MGSNQEVHALEEAREEYVLVVRGHAQPGILIRFAVWRSVIEDTHTSFTLFLVVVAALAFEITPALFDKRSGGDDRRALLELVEHRGRGVDRSYQCRAMGFVEVEVSHGHSGRFRFLKTLWGQRDICMTRKALANVPLGLAVPH